MSSASGDFAAASISTTHGRETVRADQVIK